MTKPPRMKEVGPLARFARAYNDLLDYVDCHDPQQSPQYRLKWGQNGWALEFDEATQQEVPAAGGTVAQYRVKVIKYDYLKCYPLNGSTEDSSRGYVLIAKPWELRRTGAPSSSNRLSFTEEVTGQADTSFSVYYEFQSPTWRKAYITRGSSGGGAAVENQVIIPRYIANKTVIYGIDVEDDLNNVTVESGDTGPITKLDITTRFWGKVW